MKKSFLMLGIAVLAAFVSCKKETPAADVLELLNTPETVITKDGTDTPLTVTFKATKAWTASVDADFASITPKSGDPADECKVKINVAANETTADRSFTVTLKSEGVTPVTVTFKQESQFHMNIDPVEFSVTKDGGEFTINVDANVEYAIKDYSDGSFPWQHAVPANDGKTVKVTIDKNEGLAPRQSYVKFTTEAVLDEEGNPLALRAYFTQAGSATLAWQKSLTSYNTVATVGGIHRLFTIGGQPVLSDGENIHMIDANNGSIISSEELPMNNFTTDDAGNLLVANETPYGGTLTIGCVQAPEMIMKPLISYEHNSIYSSTISNIRVKGNVLGDALVVAFTDLYTYAVCWEIKAGVVQEPVNVGLPTIANWETWTGIVWSASRNGCVVPVGTSLEDGLLYIAYDGRYTLTHVAKDGTATELYSPYADPASEGGNENFNCLATTVWNGSYMVAFEKGQFFSYGDCPDFYILNQATNSVDYFKHGLLGIETTYLGVDDGENASSDILLNVDGSGNLEVYVVDALADVIYKVVIAK